MPRTNRPRRRTRRPAEEVSAEGLARALSGWRRTESRHGVRWNVQPVSAASAVKSYVCPGCETAIPPGTAHVVVWRADGVLGDEADLAARRHWHSHCWKAH